MRKLVAFLLVISLLGFTTVITPLLRAEVPGTDVPRALGKINPTEMKPISNVQGQEIRGESWIIPVTAAIILVEIAYIHWKLVTGRALTPIERQFFNECCR